MGMRKFWSVALPFGKVAYVVKGAYIPRAQPKSSGPTLP